MLKFNRLIGKSLHYIIYNYLCISRLIFMYNIMFLTICSMNSDAVNLFTVR